MPASVRHYDQTLKTLDLERYVAMYQRKPASRKLPLLPEPLGGMIVAIDGRITSAKSQDGDDNITNPQQLWAFTVDDGSGGVNLVARKGQVVPMLTCMEAGAPVYIVGRLRFIHEVGSAEMLSSMLGWPRQPDDLVCEVLRAGASEGMDVRADFTPEAQDEERDQRHREQLAAIATEGMADVPAPSAAKLRDQLAATAVLGTATAVLQQQRDPKVGVAPGSNGRDHLLGGGPSLAEVADGYAGMPYRAIAEAARQGVNALLLDVRRMRLSADVAVRYDHEGAATIATVRIYGPQVDSGALLVADAQRWIGGFAAAMAAEVEHPGSAR